MIDLFEQMGHMNDCAITMLPNCIWLKCNERKLVLSRSGTFNYKNAFFVHYFLSYVHLNFNCSVLYINLLA